jgi:5'-methylthioadenosine phosphorylase
MADIKNNVFIAVIGGSGLYNLPGARVVEELDIDTPWGKTSDKIKIIEFSGKIIAFLSRHAEGHRYLPSEVPFQANIAALKSLGIEQIFAFSAVGSLKEELKPMDFVLPDQVIDRTRVRPSTFFGNGIVGHVAFGDPFCLLNPEIIGSAAQKTSITFHTNETCVCMEGPQFSSRAESFLYRSWGAGLINMTLLPEAKLAREAGICYNTICMVTDYDCWHESEEDVTVERVIEYLHKNAEHAQALLAEILRLASKRECACHKVIDSAVITDPKKFGAEGIKRLKFLYPKKF